MRNEKLWIKDGGWWTSEVNMINAVRGHFCLPDKVVIHDATLRDGEQTPGVVLRKDDKLALAKALDEIGVDRIEAGMPAVSDEDTTAVKEIVGLGLRARIMVFSRALKVDIDKAVDCGVWGIIMETPCGLPRLKYQFHWTEEEIINMSVEAINYAKEKGLYVSFFPYDTTRAEMRFLRNLIEEVTRHSQPDAVAVVDTTGCALPEGINYIIREIKKITDLPVEIHAHNDLGLGIANSLAAVEAGAQVIHVCLNGLGERCGNASLDEIVVCLKTLLGFEMEKIKFNKLYEIAQLTEELTGFKVAANKALTGALTFTRESGLGVDVFKKEPRVAFSVAPVFVGRKFEMVLGKKSGRPSIRTKLEELGIETTDEKIAELLAKVKQKGIQKKGILTDDEFKAILTETLQH